jgi:hypothetical protein
MSSPKLAIIRLKTIIYTTLDLHNIQICHHY